MSNNPSSILEALKRHFENKGNNTVFSQTAPELAELYTGYHNLLMIIDNLKSLLHETDLLDRLLVMEVSLKDSCFDLLQIIEAYTDRKITVHITKSGENPFKIAQKYHSDVVELMELNKIQKIYSVAEGRPILVPIKNH